MGHADRFLLRIHCYPARQLTHNTWAAVLLRHVLLRKSKKFLRKLAKSQISFVTDQYHKFSTVHNRQRIVGPGLGINRADTIVCIQCVYIIDVYSVYTADTDGHIPCESSARCTPKRIYRICAHTHYHCSLYSSGSTVAQCTGQPNGSLGFDPQLCSPVFLVRAELLYQRHLTNPWPTFVPVVHPTCFNRGADRNIVANLCI